MTTIGKTSDLISWMVGSALPFWASQGFDAHRGRFHERLDLAGKPLDVPYRSMVQARQIFVFAEASRAGWFVDGEERAARAMNDLSRTYGVANGRQLGFRFATHGRTADCFDSYGHAFVLLAIGAMHKLSPANSLVRMADQVTRFIDEVFIDPIHGGIFDRADGICTDKRQNPIMHLFEAYICLEEAMPGQGFIERATALFDLFVKHLQHAPTGVVREHFSRDWSQHVDPELASVVEPGHLFEWIWLLDRYQRLVARDLGTFLMSLGQAATAGVTPRSLILDTLPPHSFPLVPPTHRIWPHTEAIKASCVMFRRGQPSAAARADKFAKALGEHFLDVPFSGGWIDRIDASGTPVGPEVPASSLYHLALAALEAADAFRIATLSCPTANR